jgi:hypothetical protein
MLLLALANPHAVTKLSVHKSDKTACISPIQRSS